MSQRWERFAQEDAIHAILALDRPLSDQEFLAGGAPIVADMMSWAFDGLPRTRLLEIGCGMGRTALHFASHFESVDAVDVSPEMVRRARELCPAPNLRFHTIDGASLPLFEDRTFDAVFSFLVLQHVPSEEVLQSLLSEVSRVLRPGGRAALQFDTRPRSRLGELYKLLPDSLLPRKHRRYMRRYRRDPRTVEGWIDAAGLKILAQRDPGTDTHFYLLAHP
jgi:ubiquinone/menaquinone biosynthesis C-methylase UbiE